MEVSNMAEKVLIIDDEEHIVETGREAVLRTLVVECHAVVSCFGVMYIFAIITVR